MMDVQLFLAIIIGVLAFLYLFKMFKKQFTQIEKDPKCDNCPIPDEQFKNDKKN